MVGQAEVVDFANVIAMPQTEDPLVEVSRLPLLRSGFVQSHRNGCFGSRFDDNDNRMRERDAQIPFATYA
jgi:hypothetical protein